jgi:dihydroneopterin aldolase
MGVIHVSGIQVYAYHGCLEEEGILGGNYIVDVRIETDFEEAALKDDLTKTVDYVDVYKIVKQQMSMRSKLIEHAADRIASELLQQISRIEKVHVKITKLNPPVNGDLPGVAVEQSKQRH